jgi:hypothetical protein
MSIELTDLEKSTILDQHIKNLGYAMYNIQLSLREAQAVATPNQETISTLNTQLSDANAQMAVLQAESASLNLTSTEPTPQA